MTEYNEFIKITIDELYNNLINSDRTILKCYTRSEKKQYYGTFPYNSLPPKTTYLKMNTKEFKKHIILQTILKLKENNKLLQTNIKIKYEKQLVTNKYAYQSLIKYNNSLLLYINYENITDDINIKITNNNIDDVFFISEKNNNEITMDKNQLIIPTIIITSIEKIYYWKKEVSENECYNQLKILIINTNNKINNNTDINYYDIIIIRNDLFQTFIQTNRANSNNYFIYNRILFDDICIKNLYYFKSFDYRNCLNIIIINRMYINDGVNCILNGNAQCMLYEHNQCICFERPSKIDYYNKLLDYGNNLCISVFINIIYTDKYKKYIIKNEHTLKINILLSKFCDESCVNDIKRILEYYINDNLSTEFIINLLKYIKINYNDDDNIINIILKKLKSYENNYKLIINKLLNIKKKIINDIKLIYSDQYNKILIKLNDYNNKYNENTMCLTTYNEYIENIINNIHEYVYECDIDKKQIICDYNTLINIINKSLLNSQIYSNKINKYLESFNNKLKHNIINNNCFVCSNKINTYNNMTYIINCNEYICDNCNEIKNNLINYEKININIQKLIYTKNDVELYINNTINYPLTCDEKIINEINLSIQNIFINLIQCIIKNNKKHSIIIYYGTHCDYADLSKKLINSDINYKTLNNTYYNYEKTLDNMSNENENLILLQHKSMIMLSIDYKNIDYFIFYNCIAKNLLYDHDFTEINRFTKKHEKTNKTFYYIL
jgi:hypothetical protein